MKNQIRKEFFVAQQKVISFPSIFQFLVLGRLVISEKRNRNTYIHNPYNILKEHITPSNRIINLAIPSTRWNRWKM